MNDSTNPYATRGLIRESEKFVGRAQILREIFSCLTSMQSVSIIGERRIGKSSLLFHIPYVAKEGSADIKKLEGFDVCYLDLQPVESPEEFFARACDLIAPSDEYRDSHFDLEEVIKERKVVLCIDEFDQAYQRNFGSEFFNALRGLGQSGSLALVVATRIRLSELHAHYRHDDATSNFHNIFSFYPLGEFTTDEAQIMVDRKHSGFSFSDSEKEFLLKLGGNHPYKLTVACSMAYQAKQSKSDKTALLTSEDQKEISKKFKEQVSGAMSSATKIRNSGSAPLFGLLLGLIALLVGSFSANATFKPGVYLAMILSAVGLWMALKNFPWRRLTQ